jgi:hypothetical protein
VASKNTIVRARLNTVWIVALALFKNPERREGLGLGAVGVSKRRVRCQ